jgi:hypothetical protein
MCCYVSQARIKRQDEVLAKLLKSTLHRGFCMVNDRRALTLLFLRISGRRKSWVTSTHVSLRARHALMPVMTAARRLRIKGGRVIGGSCGCCRGRGRRASRRTGRVGVGGRGRRILLHGGIGCGVKR